jgi:hypothetical protein
MQAAELLHPAHVVVCVALNMQAAAGGKMSEAWESTEHAKGIPPSGTSGYCLLGLGSELRRLQNIIH